MNSLALANQLATTGQFGSALRELENGRIALPDRLAAQVLKAELLEQVGRYEQSRASVTLLLKSRDLTPPAKAACEYILGELSRRDGRTDLAVVHYERASSLATEGRDLERLCLSQLRLLLVLSRQFGPETASPL